MLKLEIVLVVMNHLKLLFIPVFMKYPQKMRLMFFADALTRISMALLPCNVDILARELPILLIIDIAAGHCYGFYKHLIVV